MSLTQETIALSQIEKQRRSYQTLSLTNYNNNLEPQIAAGGRVEDTDTLFYSGSLESITGWAGIAVSTEAYIKLIPQGDGPPETALAEFTDVVPTWSDYKQGFYGTGAAANHRYIGGLYKDAGGNYTKKWLYHSFDKSVQVIKIYGDGSIGDLNISGVLKLEGGFCCQDITIGANLILWEDSQKDVTGSPWAKAKEIICPFNGFVTTKFDFRTDLDTYTSYARIYINGVGVGITHSNSTYSFVTKTDSSITVACNDLIQVYVQSGAAMPVSVRNFRLYINETVPNSIKGLFNGMGVS